MSTQNKSKKCNAISVQ